MNGFIKLKLIKKNNTYKTQIFINGEQFDQCKFLFLNIPKDGKMEACERGSIEVKI